MRALLDWLHFLPYKMSRICEKARLNDIRRVKTMTNDVTPIYVADITAFMLCSTLMQRQ
jgi:hypothetical protein